MCSGKPSWMVAPLLGGTIYKSVAHPARDVRDHAHAVLVVATALG